MGAGDSGSAVSTILVDESFATEDERFLDQSIGPAVLNPKE